MPVKLSGHARLKAALILRDALIADLSLPLQAAMRQLATVEDTLGARAALEEDRYLEALASLCRRDGERLASLHHALRAACLKARLAPRYAQYLALLLFAHWLDARFSDPTALLARLNERLAAHPPPGVALEPFTETDLQFAAFWMATASGKTHVLHAALALLQPGQRWDRLLLITPSEALTRQHADQLRGLRQWPVFAYPLDGDASSLRHLPPDTVIVLDINKLAGEKKGDGVTIPTEAFQDGRNLVFVDEGHKGQRAEAGVWKTLQRDLAGIGSPDPRCRGLLIEFSATFGQVAEAEHAFDRYAKSVLFDYAYDRFHADRYGKDFWHLRLDSGGETGPVVRRQTLTAALVAYWHQLAAYHSDAARRRIAEAGLRIAEPLWVLLGLSVIGGNTKSDAEQTSDVVEVLRFLDAILRQPTDWTAWLGEVLAVPAGGTDLLPPEVRLALHGHAAEPLAGRILAEVFGWRAGDKPVLRLLKAAPGELGLGLLCGDTVRYFGVVNVGDASGLKKAAEQAGLSVDEDALTPSLFAGLGQDRSGINLLIGSRRFAEGWDNYRASSLILLRLGQGEGALIIQMFGRVVRFAGCNGDGKRLDHPPPELWPLQTAYLYGLRSAYLEIFLNGLYANGVVESRQRDCPTRLNLPEPSPLQAVIATTPPPSEFTVEAIGDGWLTGINTVKLSLSATLTTTTLGRTGADHVRGVAGGDLTDLFRQRLPLLNRDGLWREMVEFKRLRGWWNFRFDRAAIEAALRGNRYQVFGLPAVLEVRDGADLQRLNRLAATLLRRLFENAYRKQESRHCRYALADAASSGIPSVYHKEFMDGEDS
ncbi:MAG: DEAD/DEAH box helicase family protein [Candidatus Competibacteraceae bacterium]